MVACSFHADRHRYLQAACTSHINYSTHHEFQYYRYDSSSRSSGDAICPYFWWYLGKISNTSRQFCTQDYGLLCYVAALQTRKAAMVCHRYRYLCCRWSSGLTCRDFCRDFGSEVVRPTVCQQDLTRWPSNLVLRPQARSVIDGSMAD